MEYISKITGHWLEIVTAVYFAGMVCYGHRRGFVRIAVSTAAMLFTLIAVKVAIPYATNWIKYHTPVYDKVKESMVEHVKLDEILEQMHIAENIQREDEWKIIENMPIPELIKEKVIENNNLEVYKEMGVNYFQEYIIGYLADTILNAVIFVTLYVIGYVAIQLLVKWLDLIARLPVLSGINQIAGALLGGAQAMLIIWIICLLVTALSGTEIGKMILELIAESKWLSWIYGHNLFTYLFLGWIFHAA